MPTPRANSGLRVLTLPLAVAAAVLGLAASLRTSAAPSLVLWDTGTPLPSSTAAPVDRTGWKVVPSDLLALEVDPAKSRSDPGYYGRDYSFRGDAVIESRHLLVVFSSALGRATLFSSEPTTVGATADTPREPHWLRIGDCAPLRADAAVAGLSRVELIRHAADEIALGVTFGPAGGTNAPATFRVDRSEIVDVRLPAGFSGLRVWGPIEYGVVPGFVGDDLIYAAGSYPEARTLHLPAESLFLGLLGSGNQALVTTWPRGSQQLRLQVAPDTTGHRVLESFDIETATGNVYLAPQSAPGLWYRQKLLPSNLEAPLQLAWRRPFPARWKTLLYEGEVKTTFAFRESRGQIWRGVAGSYDYPAWFEGETAFLRFGKKIPPRDECLIYCLEPQDTPGSIATPADVLRATIGRAAADELLDPAGRKLRTHHRRGSEGVRRACTCGCTEAIQVFFEKGSETDCQGDIREALADMAFFVTRHVQRIEEYRRFVADLTPLLEQAGKVDSSLTPFTDALIEIAGAIPQEIANQAENMKSPRHAEALTRRTMALTERHDPGNLKAYLELLKEWRDMGGSQDYVVALCHTATRQLFQEAGYRGAENPNATRLAQEVRQRCRQVLRNPDGYEIWSDY